MEDCADISDPVEHGTAVCSLLIACVPKVDIIMLKCFDSQESVYGISSANSSLSTGDTALYK